MAEFENGGRMTSCIIQNICKQRGSIKTFNKFYYKIGTQSVHVSAPSQVTSDDKISGAASSISEGAIFIYSCSGQLCSFEIDLISKELNCAEHEYMNMAPSLIELATPLDKI